MALFYAPATLKSARVPERKVIDLYDALALAAAAFTLCTSAFACA